MAVTLNGGILVAIEAPAVFTYRRGWKAAA